MEVNGTVKKILPLQEFGSGFKKRELIVTTQEQYPQVLSLEFIQDKIPLLDSLQEGDLVKVGINLRGREWTNTEGVTKYFNTVSGWRVEKVNQHTSSGSDTSMPPMPPIASQVSGDNGDDDLPF